MNNSIDHISALKEIISDMMLTGRASSLRDVAALLDTNSGTLTQVLSNKRKLPFTLFEKLSADFTVNDYQKIKLSKGLSNSSYKKIKNKIHFTEDREEQARVDHLTFVVLSQWYHFAILSLMQTNGFKSEPRWIASRLGLELHQVKSALSNLLQLGLIKEKNNTLIRTNKSLETSPEVYERANVKGYLQEMNTLGEKFFKDTEKQNNFSSITIPIDKQIIEELHSMTERYLDQVDSLSRKSKPTEVFTLNVQFYQISNTVNE